MQPTPDASLGELVTAVKRATKAKTIPEGLRNFDLLPDSSFVRLPVVCGLFGMAPATVWRHVSKGTIPAPRRFSTRCTAWSVGSLRDMLKAG